MHYYHIYIYSIILVYIRLVPGTNQYWSVRVKFAFSNEYYKPVMGFDLTSDRLRVRHYPMRHTALLFFNTRYYSSVKCINVSLLNVNNCFAIIDSHCAMLFCRINSCFSICINILYMYCMLELNTRRFKQTINRFCNWPNSLQLAVSIHFSSQRGCQRLFITNYFQTTAASFWMFLSRSFSKLLELHVPFINTLSRIWTFVSFNRCLSIHCHVYERLFLSTDVHFL